MTPNDMKGLKPRATPIDPEEAVRIARETAPHQPPAMAAAPAPGQVPPSPASSRVATAMLAQRFTEPTLDSLARVAREIGANPNAVHSRGSRRYQNFRKDRIFNVLEPAVKLR